MLRALRLLTAVCLLSACGEETDEAGARALWDRIHAENYRSWTRPAGWESRQPTVSVHGQTADIFVNPIVSSAAAGPALSEWPDDSVLVKDGYRDGALALIAAMEKRGNGWFFAEWSDSGKTKFAGSPSVCIDCHQGAPDFVFSTVLP